jgi:hypothetical protein
MKKGGGSAPPFCQPLNSAGYTVTVCDHKQYFTLIKLFFISLSFFLAESDFFKLCAELVSFFAENVAYCAA